MYKKIVSVFALVILLGTMSVPLAAMAASKADSKCCIASHECCCPAPCKGSKDCCCKAKSCKKACKKNCSKQCPTGSKTATSAVKDCCKK